MSTASKDTRSFSKHDVKNALCKLFKQKRLVEVNTKRSKQASGLYELHWTGKALRGKKTFVICFLGADGWSSWTREDTQKGKWLVAAEAIANGGGYLTYPLDDTKPSKVKFVKMPKSVEELLIEGDLA